MEKRIAKLIPSTGYRLSLPFPQLPRVLMLYHIVELVCLHDLAHREILDSGRQILFQLGLRVDEFGYLGGNYIEVQTFFATGFVDDDALRPTGRGR